MMQFLLFSIFVAASLSLVSYVYCWNDIRSGHPHIISLRQITSIMDRHQLNQRFGMHEAGYYYTLTPEQVFALVRRYRLFYMLECIADAVCIFGVWMATTGQMKEDNIPLFISLSGLCQAINLVYSVWVIRKWHLQLQEEIENTED